MQITDPIADLLTRIRNASAAKHDSVEIPASNMKKAIVQILVDEGYVKSYTVAEDGKQGMIKVVLKYGEGVAIVSTSKGVMTDRQARKENIGGEVLAFIW